MRRIRPLMALLTALFLLLTIAPAVSAEDRPNLDAASLQKVNVTIDGVTLQADAYIVNSRTMVPLRAIFEALGATIEWDSATFTVTATKGPKVIKLTVGAPTAKVNGQDVTLAVPAVLINSRTFVPFRFVGDALGAEIAWDQGSFTAQIKTGGGCTLAPYQVHEGNIAPGGETWGRCGSPHVVKGTFLVEGKDSPILSIQDGAVVQFEENGRIEVGRNAPGGLKVYGTESAPIVFTAATSGPQAGFWHGLRFFNQTLINDTVIENARIEYAGENEYGAVYVEGWDKTVEIVMKNVEIKNSQYAGLHLYRQGRLKAGSANLKINGTKVAGENGGFPIITGAFGSHNLPRGEFKNNAVNAVYLFEAGASSTTIAQNTTWRNVSIPYAIEPTVYVEGATAPTLTIEPGVITLWKSESGLVIGQNASGHLVADATARPEGGGEWFIRPEGGGEWRVEKAELDLGVQVADAGSLEPGCALCGKNRAIVFGAWNAAPERGAWDGIRLLSKAGDKSRLNGVVVAYAGTNDDWEAGIYAEANSGTVKFKLSNSLITQAVRSGLELYGNAQLTPESTGNTFKANGWPVRMNPNQIGFLPKGQTFEGNDKQVISIYTSGSSEVVTKTATWWNHGVPYQFDLTVYIGGTASPVITIEPGAVLLFGRDHHLTVGTQDGNGSLVAVGQAGKPIKFTAEAERAGAWAGINFTEYAGKGNRLEYAVIEYATVGVTVGDDLGAFLKNATIRNSAEMGVQRAWGTEGTDFLRGLGNQFEGNALDQNQE